MEWIKLIDELPNKTENYLTVTELNENTFISILLFDVDEEEWKEYDNKYDDYVCVDGITYWQHLPKIPK
tara:strand:+ start:197 stop:403 length:207 start_codon:yes stop_codon:yes gene_type:complete